MSDVNQEGAVRLVDPEVPADQGLSSLGLIMQLAGSVFAAVMALMTFSLLVMPRGMGGEKAILLLVVAASIARSLFQRQAGTELLYGRRSFDGAANQLTGVKRYILIALGHTALLTVIMIGKFNVPTKIGIGMALGLAAWPLLLGVLLQLPRFKRFDNAEIPVSEDKGFESAAILMVVLGTCGVLGTGAALLMMLQAGSRALSQGPGVLILLALVMLVIRSCLHVQAGLSGLRETSVDRSVELANRYANFGVISSFCAGGAVLLMTMMIGMNLMMFVVVAGLCWILMAWPMIIRRFFSERQFADLMAGDNANLHRRAPDAGLTGLGWLLLGHAAYGATFLIPQLVVGPDLFEGGKMAEMMATMGPVGTKSLWWSAGLIALQAFAGFELIRMSGTHRIVGTIYAVVSAALTVYMMWPMLKAMTGGMRGMGRMGPEMVMMFVPIAISLVLPVATLLLVNRKIAPVAKARFRPAPQGTIPQG